MTTYTNHSAFPADDQAARLRELVARLDHAREEHEPPAHTSPDREGPTKRHRRQPQPIRVAEAEVRTASVIAIASGKGGVGKTSLSVNLCAKIAHRGARVILLDGDFGLANADLLCGVRVGAHLGHVLDGSRSLEDVLIETPAGFRLAPGASGLASMLRSSATERQAVVDHLAGMDTACDVVVIDCGAGMGDEVCSFMRAADLSVIVTTPEPPAIADAYALIKRLVRTTTDSSPHAPPPQLVVNMCEDERDAMRTHRRIASVAARFLNVPIPLLGWTPTDSAVSEAVRERTPFVQLSPRSDVSRAVGRLARSLEQEMGLPAFRLRRSKRSAGFWRRLFSLSVDQHSRSPRFC